MIFLLHAIRYWNCTLHIKDLSKSIVDVIEFSERKREGDSFEHNYPHKTCKFQKYQDFYQNTLFKIKINVSNINCI